MDSKEQEESSEEYSVSTDATEETVASEGDRQSENVSIAEKEKVEHCEEKEDKDNEGSSSVVSEQAKSISHHPPTDIQRAQQEDKETEAAAAGGGWGWGAGWGGLGNLLSSSVTTVSGSAQAIGRGIGSVVSTVEETLGVPSPQELIVEEKEDDDKQIPKKENSGKVLLLFNILTLLSIIQEEELAPDASKQATQEDQQQDTTSPSFGGFWTAVQSTVSAGHNYSLVCSWFVIIFMLDNIVLTSKLKREMLLTIINFYWKRKTFLIQYLKCIQEVVYFFHDDTTVSYCEPEEVRYA